MPYLNKERKTMLHEVEAADLTVGDLNFIITTMAIEFMKGRKFNYENLNNTYGAMQLAAAEFKRRLIDPYEDKKIAENGDVYPEALLKNVSQFSSEELKQMVGLGFEENRFPNYDGPDPEFTKGPHYE